MRRWATVHLHVDGSTAQRPGTWASLELVMTTIPGRQNTMGRPIYILPLELEQGIAVSETQGGTLRLPELPGFALEIAPGSVTFPGGGRSGTVSVTLVHNDKIPMPPNYSQQPRFVITVQPGGALFDPPARVSFPNVDGLLPGQVTELYSFDHHAGRFVSIGPAAVSENGVSIDSLPGFGIVEGAWHCGGDPAAAGTPHSCPVCQVCLQNYCAIDPAKTEPPCEDDGDPCTVDFCDGGECMHWQKQITSVEAFGNGKKVVRILRGGRVDFEYTAETEHCATLTQVWDFGDGVMSTVPRPSRVYNELGDFPFRVDVKCDGDCARGADGGAVVVKCPKVEITGMDPDIDYLCPGCTKQFFLQTDPPGTPVSWRVKPGTDLGGKATISQSGLLTIAADAPTGSVTVEVAEGGLFELCMDSHASFVFNPEDGFRMPDPRCLRRAFTARGRANTGLRDHIPVGCRQDWNVGNAFVHALASCTIAAECGESPAESIGNLNEDARMDNPCQRARMDLHNNAVGRRLGRGALAADCEGLVLGALRRGELRWYNPPEPPDTDACAPLDRALPPGSACTPQ
ncbi:MAG: hypothetical protein HC897_14090 [Thermoanaerobaculia bacterium]|nr:hypothetical protein [Thermoanaerobaculia bacterium]